MNTPESRYALRGDAKLVEELFRRFESDSDTVLPVKQLLVVIREQNIARPCTGENEDVIDMHVPMSLISEHGFGFRRRGVDAQVEDFKIRFNARQILDS